MIRAVTPRDVLRAWHTLVAMPKQAAGESVARFDQMVLAACIIELSTVRPSTPEIGELIGCCHSAVLHRLERWRALPWRDRHGWLDFIERGVMHEMDRKR